MIDFGARKQFSPRLDLINLASISSPGPHNTKILQLKFLTDSLQISTHFSLSHLFESHPPEGIIPNTFVH